MVKLVLVVFVLLLVVPLIRRARGGGGAQQKPKDDGDEGDAPPAAPADFSALMRTVVLLDDNDWGACTFDGVKEDWTRFTSEPTRGFSTIYAGRHRASTKVGDRDAVVDFVLRPGDLFARRLDRDAAAWVALDDAALARARRDAEGGETGKLADALVRYRTTLGVARAMSGGAIASPEAAFEKARAELDAILEAASGAAPPADLEARARAAGDALVGVPLLQPQLDALVSAVSAASARGGEDRAARIRALGELVLPGAFAGGAAQRGETRKSGTSGSNM